MRHVPRQRSRGLCNTPVVSTLRHEYDRVVAKLRSGRHYGVFMDDTGSPGLVTPGLSAGRKSWVAVLVPPQQVVDVLDQFPQALAFLQELGLNDPEFHFTDIWAGKGEFEKLDLQQRLAIFSFMAEIFSTYSFRILVQTFDPNNAKDVQDRATWPQRFGPLKFDEHADLALIFALVRIRLYLKSLADGNATACVFVDEGRLPSGNTIVLPGLAPTFHDGTVLFASSQLVLPIQLADFAAFVMNRWQLLRVRSELSDLDKTFLEIVTPIAENFVNIDTVAIHGWPDVSNIRQGMN